MAKREIKRQVEETMPDESATETADSAVTAKVEVKEPVVENLDVSVTVSKRPAVVAIRALRGVILFNDGFKMRKEKLDPDKPVIVRISQ
jgi:hypothetical protein